MARNVKMVCKECGSTDVGMDATVVWSFIKQAWVIADICDTSYCNRCSEQRDLVEQEVPKDEALRPYVEKTVFELAAMVETADDDLLRAIGNELGFRNSFKAKRLAQQIASRVREIA